MRMRMPPRRRPAGTPSKRKPAGTFKRLGLTRAELQKQKQNPAGTPKPAGRQPTAAETARYKAMLEEAYKKQNRKSLTGNRLQKPLTSQQRAAMRKQAIASRGNDAITKRRTEDRSARRAVKQGYATPGQVRSMKMSRQKLAQGKFAPKRTTKRTSRRLV